MSLSIAEENHLKTIFVITQLYKQKANTNAIAEKLETKASSVTDMIKRLAEKKLVHYEKYRPVKLTTKGKNLATGLIRSHRLWETFLVEKLGFNWSEVHDIAESLEHIQNDQLIDRLADYLNHPLYDPHGDPIPDKEGNFPQRATIALSSLKEGECGRLSSVEEDDQSFLEVLNTLKIAIGSELYMEKWITYDASFQIGIDGGESQLISSKICDNLHVIKI